MTMSINDFNQVISVFSVRFCFGFYELKLLCDAKILFWWERIRQTRQHNDTSLTNERRSKTAADSGCSTTFHSSLCSLLMLSLFSLFLCLAVGINTRRDFHWTVSFWGGCVQWFDYDFCCCFDLNFGSVVPSEDFLDSSRPMTSLDDFGWLHFGKKSWRKALVNNTRLSEGWLGPNDFSTE